MEYDTAHITLLADNLINWVKEYEQLTNIPWFTSIGIFSKHIKQKEGQMADTQ